MKYLNLESATFLGHSQPYTTEKDGRKYVTCFASFLTTSYSGKQACGRQVFEAKVPDKLYQTVASLTPDSKVKVSFDLEYRSVSRIEAVN